MRINIYSPTDCPYYLISRIYLQITADLKKGFAQENVEKVKPAYLGLLLVLWEEEGLRLGELSKRSGLEPSSMTALLDRMERDGLAYRSPDPHDRRVYIIHLTEQGRNIRNSVHSVIDNVIGNVFQGVSEEEFSNLKNTLKKVLANTNKGIDL